MESTFDDLLRKIVQDCVENSLNQICEPEKRQQVIINFEYPTVMTIDRFAEKVGVSVGTVRGWRNNPLITQIKKEKIGTRALVNVSYLLRTL